MPHKKTSVPSLSFTCCVLVYRCRCVISACDATWWLIARRTASVWGIFLMLELLWNGDPAYEVCNRQVFRRLAVNTRNKLRYRWEIARRSLSCRRYSSASGVARARNRANLPRKMSMLQISIKFHFWKFWIELLHYYIFMWTVLITQTSVMAAQHCRISPTPKLLIRSGLRFGGTCPLFPPPTPLVHTYWPSSVWASNNTFEVYFSIPNTPLIGLHTHLHLFDWCK